MGKERDRIKTRIGEGEKDLKARFGKIVKAEGKIDRTSARAGEKYFQGKMGKTRREGAAATIKI